MQYAHVDKKLRLRKTDSCNYTLTWNHADAYVRAPDVKDEVNEYIVNFNSIFHICAHLAITVSCSGVSTTQPIREIYVAPSNHVGNAKDYCIKWNSAPNAYAPTPYSFCPSATHTEVSIPMRISSTIHNKQQCVQILKHFTQFQHNITDIKEALADRYHGNFRAEDEQYAKAYYYAVWNRGTNYCNIGIAYGCPPVQSSCTKNDPAARICNVYTKKMSRAEGIKSNLYGFHTMCPPDVQFDGYYIPRKTRQEVEAQYSTVLQTPFMQHRKNANSYKLVTDFDKYNKLDNISSNLLKEITDVANHIDCPAQIAEIAEKTLVESWGDAKPEFYAHSTTSSKCYYFNIRYFGTSDFSDYKMHVSRNRLSFSTVNWYQQDLDVYTRNPKNILTSIPQGIQIQCPEHQETLSKNAIRLQNVLDNVVGKCVSCDSTSYKTNVNAFECTPCPRNMKRGDGENECTSCADDSSVWNQQTRKCSEPILHDWNSLFEDTKASCQDVKCNWETALDTNVCNIKTETSGKFKKLSARKNVAFELKVGSSNSGGGFRIPANALKGDQNISCTVVLEPKENSPRTKIENLRMASEIMSFEPHGLKFDKPVEIKMRMSIERHTSLTYGLFYFNTSLLDPVWERVSGVKFVQENGILYALGNVTHFSTFGTMETNSTTSSETPSSTAPDPNSPAATTVIARPGIRTLKLVMAAALMMRRRTRSPGANSPVQFAALS